ncbi:Inhibitor of growth protein 5 [Entomortierella beljakovae]|nr:Inhibitor of growth protein 5 [Entomortierella beljakovae]
MSQVNAKSAEFIDNVLNFSPQERIQLLKSLNEMLVESLRQGEEKVALATAAYDVVDRHVRRLDDDLQKYEDEQMIGPGRLGNTSSSTSGAAAAADRKEESSNATASATVSNKKGASSSTQDGSSSKRKKQTHNGANSGGGSAAPASSTSEKRKGGAVAASGSSKVAKKTASLAELPIDPNEPLYCYCQQVSYGEMVACDNGDRDFTHF